MATDTWGGSNPGDWNVGSNWVQGTIPAAGDTALVASGMAVLQNGAVDTINGLIANGVVLVGGNFTGNTSAATINLGFATVTAVGEFAVVNQLSTIDASTGISNDGTLGGGGTYIGGDIINDNVIIADGDIDSFGSLVIDTSITGTGSIAIDANATIVLNTAETQAIDLNSAYDPSGGLSTVVLGNGITSAGPLVFNTLVAGGGLDLVLTGRTVAAGGATVTGGTLAVTTSAGAESFTLSGATNYTATVLNPGAANASIEVTPVCYAAGTRIATPAGEVAVENLRPGDVVLTADGTAKPVKWIGHRRADCRRHPEPRKVWPIRIQADAFGPGLPARDLRVSPQHGIYVDGVLIPAKVLVNGSTVRQERMASVEYFHVELDRHEVLLAEGLPAESYLDTGDRAAFENGGVPMVLHPDFARLAWDARACAELRVVGSEVERTRALLASRASRIAATRPEAAPAVG